MKYSNQDNHIMYNMYNVCIYYIDSIKYTIKHIISGVLTTLH